MAYDEVLAHRVRELLAGERGVTEKRMFGGLAFLIDAKMAVAISREGGLLLRVDPAQLDQLLTRVGARVCVMRGREMNGWLRVGDEALRTKRQLNGWVMRAVTYARSLPTKPRGGRSTSRSAAH